MKIIKTFKITEEELKFIHGNDYDFFRSKILPNCYCHNCYDYKHCSTITNYYIHLIPSNNIVLKGFCAKCGGKIARYLETGESEEYLPRINQISGNHALKSWRPKKK